MAEITKERQGQLVRKAFEVLSRHPDGLPAREVIGRVEKELGLTPFEQSFYPSNPNVRRFERRRAYEQFQTPEAFMREAWVEHYSGIPEEQRSLLPLRTVRFLAPSE